MAHDGTFNLVFVCTGNICRSPMAEGIMRELILDEAKRRGVSPPVRVMSAGIYATPGNMASTDAIVAAAEDGVDLSFHRSKQLTGEMVLNADLLLTMETGHADMIRRTWPDTGEVIPLKIFGRTGDVVPHPDIPDPIGMGLQVYRTVYRELKHEIARVAPLIFSRAVHATGDG